MFCDQCGATVAPEARFCEECGAPLGRAALKPAQNLTQEVKRRGWLWLAVGGGTVLLITGALIIAHRSWFDPDKRANQLFVEASQLVQSAQEAEKTSYTEALKLYQAALTKIEKITTQYSSSQLAVEISQGEAKIGPYSVTELKETVFPQAKEKAEAEENLLNCALFVAGTDDTFLLVRIARMYLQAGEKDKALEIVSRSLQIARTMTEADDKATALWRIASWWYVEVGEKGQAVEVLREALEATKAIEEADDKALTLADIASTYAKAGQKTKASEMLSQALQVANTIVDASSKAWALANIAGAYAEAGQYAQALQVANTIVDASVPSKAQALADIASTYVQTGQKIDESAKKILHEIVREVTYSPSKLGEQESLTAQSRANLKEAIIGKWKDDKAGETWEFFKDGTLMMVVKPESVGLAAGFGIPTKEGLVSFTLKYGFVDERRFKIEMEAMGFHQALIFEVAAFTNDSLGLKNEQSGASNKLTRIR